MRSCRHPAGLPPRWHGFCRDTGSRGARARRARAARVRSARVARTRVGARASIRRAPRSAPAAVASRRLAGHANRPDRAVRSRRGEPRRPARAARPRRRARRRAVRWAPRGCAGRSISCTSIRRSRRRRTTSTRRASTARPTGASFGATAYDDRWDGDGRRRYLDMLAPRLEALAALLAPDRHALGARRLARGVPRARAPRRDHGARRVRQRDRLAARAEPRPPGGEPPVRPHARHARRLRTRSVRSSRRRRASSRSSRRGSLGRRGPPFTTAPRGDYTDASIARLEAEGRVHRTASGRVYMKYFLVKNADGTHCRERRVDALWTDVPPLRHARAGRAHGLSDAEAARAARPHHRVRVPGGRPRGRRLRRERDDRRERARARPALRRRRRVAARDRRRRARGSCAPARRSPSRPAGRRASVAREAGGRVGAACDAERVEAASAFASTLVAPREPLAWAIDPAHDRARPFRTRVARGAHARRARPRGRARGDRRVDRAPAAPSRCASGTTTAASVDTVEVAVILRDPVHGLVAFEGDEERIVERLLDTPEVQRLRRVRQLGRDVVRVPGRRAHALRARDRRRVRDEAAPRAPARDPRRAARLAAGHERPRARGASPPRSCTTSGTARSRTSSRTRSPARRRTRRGRSASCSTRRPACTACSPSIDAGASRARRRPRARPAPAPVPREGRERRARRRSLRLPPARRPRDGRSLRPLRPRLAPSQPALRAVGARARRAGARHRRRQGPAGHRGVHHRAPLHVPAGVPAQGDARRGVDDPHRPRRAPIMVHRATAARSTASPRGRRARRRAASAIALATTSSSTTACSGARCTRGRARRTAPLADLARRIRARALFKTLELFGEQATPEGRERALASRARRRARARATTPTCTSASTSRPTNPSAHRRRRSWSSTRRAPRGRSTKCRSCSGGSPGRCSRASASSSRRSCAIGSTHALGL